MAALCYPDHFADTCSSKLTRVTLISKKTLNKTVLVGLDAAKAAEKAGITAFVSNASWTLIPKKNALRKLSICKGHRQAGDQSASNSSVEEGPKRLGRGASVRHLD